MLINVKVSDEKQAIKFVNDILKDLGKEETDSLNYNGDKIQIAPEIRSKHISEGPKDITIESFLNLHITTGDLDFETQGIIQKHKNLLNRL